MYKICVTNRHLVKGDYLEQIKKVVNTDISALMLREKDLDEDTYKKLSLEVMKVCENAGVDLIINKFINVADELGVKRIHLPFQDFKNRVASNNIDTKKYILGTSTHSVEDAIYANNNGASYITAGHIFATDCKKGLEPRGLVFLSKVCNAVDIPAYAIGGINKNNMQACIDSGADGVCIMSGYMTL